MKILLVEDDITLAMGIEYSLKNEGFEVISCDTVKKAKEVIKDIVFNMILLDVTLPDGNGFELCKYIRNKIDTPIIFLTACDEEVNVVLGLDMGADDYLAKPIRVRELIARINAVLRRRGIKDEKPKDKIILNDLVIYPLKYEVYKKDERIVLSSGEYKLLLLLIENSGNVLTRKQLLEKLWDAEGDFIEEKTLTVYIKRLRQKLKEDKQNPYIETVRGIGYRWLGDN
ncbi:MAG: response regulator transcription factor [Clostridiaceae bacterium]|nr:response regulator transcription factor [Clostridiaceae bacterium]